jgi:hypothetical protein
VLIYIFILFMITTCFKGIDSHDLIKTVQSNVHASTIVVCRQYYVLMKWGAIMDI